jgi:hypothetical protein
MDSSTINRSRPAIALAATLLLASAGFAQSQPTSQQTKEPQTSTDTWRDQIGPNDVQVLGKIAAVRDETFTLRSHDATFIFQIPTDSTQSAAVRTGNDVQVWYDPAGYERDGSTYYRVSRLIPADETTGRVATATTDANDTSVTQTESQAAAARDADAAERAQRAEEAEEAEDAEAEREASATAERNRLDDERSRLEDERSRLEDERAAARDNDALDSEQDAENARYDDDRQTLPQTAGSLPLVAVVGLLALFGAAALRLYLR